MADPADDGQFMPPSAHRGSACDSSAHESAPPVSAPPKRSGTLGPSVTTGPVRATLLLLALPVLGEQILNTLVGLFDTWLAGRFSPVATSAVGLAAYVGWLASMIAMLVGTGTTALVSRHVGGGRSREARRVTNQSMTLAVLVGVAISVCFYTAAPALAWSLNMRDEAYHVTVNYIRIESTGHLFMSLAIVGSAALRGAGDMRTPMLIFAAVNAVNIVASCTFVYVLKLGVNGIVFGTVTARMVGGVLIVAVLARGRAGMLLRRRELGILWPRTRRILRIGVPAAVDGAIMWLGHVALLAVVGRVAAGQIAFAAHIIAVRVEALTYLPAVAWGTATATMVGQALGAGDRRRAMRSGLEAVLQCGVFSLVVAVVFYAGADWIYAQMSRNLEVGAMGVGPFRVLAVLQPTMVVSIVLVWGLRGAGDTRVPMLITIVGIVIRLSAGYYFGIVKEGGLMGAWMGMFGDMIWRAAATAVRYVRGRWLETSV